MSLASAGAQGNGDSFTSAISADGRYVVFASYATNLVPADENSDQDVFVRDRWLGLTTCVSIDSGGAKGNGGSHTPSISADGRFVAFVSDASNLVAGDTNGAADVFVRDRVLLTTERVSVGAGGVEGDEDSLTAAISADGRFVVFASQSTNLVQGDTNARSDVFVHDRFGSTTERVSLSSSGEEGDDFSSSPMISADGRFVTFVSTSTNLVDLDANGVLDVFVHDRQTGETERVSVHSDGTEGDADSLGPAPVSADGRYVAFHSAATTLVDGDKNDVRDVFLRDRDLGTTQRVSVGASRTEADDDSGSPSISADGRFVAFDSEASNLVLGDTNDDVDVFLRDRELETTERVSLNSSSDQGNAESFRPSVSDDGRLVAFESDSSNLVLGDTNGWEDVFVHDRAATGFVSLCDPGVGGTVACPCSNPPSELGRGCDNSASTGGAILAAAGAAYLTMDTLVFTSRDERPEAFSIIMQGNDGFPDGFVYGQGARCLGGTIIRRLYIKTAVGGSITAPDSSAGDPSVSARSAAKGDPIQAGTSRWYLVYYRDPIVLGGCTATTTFNTTQTVQITWSR